MFCVGTLPWFNTVIWNVTLSPTLNGPLPNLTFVRAKSNRSTNTDAGSASSSSPPSLLIVLSVTPFTTPPLSLAGLLSGVLSTSVRVTPTLSCAPLISARFTKEPPAKLASIKQITDTVVLVPAKIGPATVRVAVLPAPAVHAGSFKVNPAGK